MSPELKLQEHQSTSVDPENELGAMSPELRRSHDPGERQEGDREDHGT